MWNRDRDEIHCCMSSADVSSQFSGCMPLLGRLSSSADKPLYGCFQLLEYSCVPSHLDLFLSLLVLHSMIGGMQGRCRKGIVKVVKPVNVWSTARLGDYRVEWRESEL